MTDVRAGVESDRLTITYFDESCARFSNTASSAALIKPFSEFEALRRVEKSEMPAYHEAVAAARAHEAKRPHAVASERMFDDFTIDGAPIAKRLWQKIGSGGKEGSRWLPRLGHPAAFPQLAANNNRELNLPAATYRVLPPSAKAAVNRDNEIPGLDVDVDDEPNDDESFEMRHAGRKDGFHIRTMLSSSPDGADGGNEEEEEGLPMAAPGSEELPKEAGKARAAGKHVALRLDYPPGEFPSNACADLYAHLTTNSNHAASSSVASLVATSASTPDAAAPPPPPLSHRLRSPLSVRMCLFACILHPA